MHALPFDAVLATIEWASYEVLLSAKHNYIERADSEWVEFLVRKPFPSATTSAH